MTLHLRATKAGGGAAFAIGSDGRVETTMSAVPAAEAIKRSALSPEGRTWCIEDADPVLSNFPCR